MCDDPIKIRSGDLWCWKWRHWTSPGFAYLEDRPWTPLPIAGRLCFVASDRWNLDESSELNVFEQAKWCVVWGDEIGPWFDDVSNLCEYRGQPIYVVRQGQTSAARYAVVWGHCKSQMFAGQIAYEAAGDAVFIRRFDPRKGAVGPRIAATWQNIAAAAVGDGDGGDRE